MVGYFYLYRNKSPERLCLLSVRSDFFRDEILKGLLGSKVKVGKIRIEKNREFSTIFACVSVKS